MKKMKKHLAGLLTVIMMFSLLVLPEGLTAKAAEGIPEDDYFICFDADKGKLYKETGVFRTYNTLTLSEEYNNDSSITCSDNQLTLHNFNRILYKNNTAIVIKGNAKINLIGENIINYSDSLTPVSTRYSDGYGIYADGSLTITGTGSLTCTAHADGIYCTQTLTITNTTLTAIGNNFGIRSDGNFITESGSVTGIAKNLSTNAPAITSTVSGIYSGKKLLFNGGTLIGDTTNAASSINYAVYGNSGIETKNTDNTIFFNKKDETITPKLSEEDHYYRLEENNTMERLNYIKLATKAASIESPSTSTSPELVIGGTTDLEVTVVPETASNTDITWTSSDENVATVDDDGTVTAKAEGSATITATVTNPDGTEVTKEFDVTVSKKDGPAAPTGITGVAPTTIGGSDGKLTGVTTTMEYSTDTEFTDAKDCTGSEVTGLPAGTYYVRVKETDDTKAGTAVSISVPQTGTSGTGNGTSTDNPSASGNGTNTNNPSASGNGTGTNNPASGDGTGSGTGSNDNPSKSEQSIMDKLGVSADTAKQILDEAAKLGVSEDTLLITDAGIKALKSDADIKGSSFGLLKAQATNLKKNSITVKWSKVKDADGYIIYGNKCGAKNSYKKLKTIKKNSTCKFTQKKLKKGTYYKYLVVAYKKIAGTTVTIAAAKTIHATTTGGKYGVAKAVKVNKTKKTLAPSKTFKIKASEIKKDKKIRQHRKIKYESSNRKIATVNGKGVVKAKKKKGSCYIYVYAQNGVYKRIKITVK